MSTTASISEVAALTGLSTRTLRHYDQIGLLTPSATDPSGVRHYDSDALVRLQEILLLRRMGVGLAEIAGILDDGHDRLDALRKHHEQLLAEGERLARMTATVARTIETLEQDMTPHPGEIFEGFDAEQQARWEDDLVERYGDEVKPRIAASHRAVGTLSKEQASEIQAAYEDSESRMAALLDEGVAPDDARVRDVLDGHYATVCRFWTPDADAYAGLGDLYVEHPDFRARYESRREGLAEYLRAGMLHYSLNRL